MILGPTAGGKSSLAVGLAVALAEGGESRAEIVSADSMQVYRHLDAGTAKPTAEQRSAAVHHLIDIVEPTRPFTVANWYERAEAVMAKLDERSVRAIVVGGTNLYLQALLRGLMDAPPRDDAVRAELEALPSGRLVERVRAVDPASAARIDSNDRRRLVRALEVYELTGRPLSEGQTQWHDHTPYRHDPILLGLAWPVEALNRRINARVKAMFQRAAAAVPDASLADALSVGVKTRSMPESLPEEVRRLDAAGLLGPQAREALGYKQVLSWLHGGDPRVRSEADAMEATKVQTRRYAKQQRTWLKRYRDVRWLEPADQPTAEVVAQAIAAVREAEAERPGD